MHVKSTLMLSHVSKFEPKFALVADFLVFELELEDSHYNRRDSQAEA